MQKYAEWSPTGFDPAGLNCEDQQDWLVLPIGLKRDSGALEKANWEAAQDRLPGPDGGAWEIHHFGHWACGWFEIMLLRPGSDAIEVGGNIEEEMNNGYPVLDEELLMQYETEDADESWDCWAREEAWSALEALLPEELAEALNDDREVYLKDRFLDEDQISNELYSNSEYYSTNEGTSWDRYGEEETLKAFPNLNAGLELIRERKIAAQTAPLPFA